LPSHVAASVATPAVHEALRHGVSSLLNPLQDAPSMPLQAGALHTLPPVAPPHTGRPLTGAPITGTQLPIASLVLHASHWPAHGLLQQTPSTQLGAARGHPSLLVHFAPCASDGAHTPDAQ
jgi:hypothetical protein